MPARQTAPAGAPCWVDLMTSDTDRSRAFYCELFGWAAEEPAAEFGGYFNFTSWVTRADAGWPAPAAGWPAQPGTTRPAGAAAKPWTGRASRSPSACWAGQ
ncbi:MAG TPA: hypothetical protein VMV92_14685 [Streptosporangiaceae bacterium]|nr:hypothetical protein [Streptosporangiaceae bacterium]